MLTSRCSLCALDVRFKDATTIFLIGNKARAGFFTFIRCTWKKIIVSNRKLFGALDHDINQKGHLFSPFIANHAYLRI